jgi:hypothetical protein
VRWSADCGAKMLSREGGVYVWDLSWLLSDGECAGELANRRVVVLWTACARGCAERMNGEIAVRSWSVVVS